MGVEVATEGWVGIILIIIIILLVLAAVVAIFGRLA